MSEIGRPGLDISCSISDVRDWTSEMGHDMSDLGCPVQFEMGQLCPIVLLPRPLQFHFLMFCGQPYFQFSMKVYQNFNTQKTKQNKTNH